MKFNVIEEQGIMTIELEGRLDTNSAPELDRFLRESLGNTEELIFELQQLEYISSAGLRVFLFAHKTMEKKGGLRIVGCNEDVMGIFEITGFSDILKIE